MPIAIKKIVEFISKLTLEIYVVQNVLIEVIRNRNVIFPINWMLITASIIIFALLLHIVCEYMYKSVDKIMIIKGEK